MFFKKNHFRFIIPELETYKRDKRLSLTRLYKSFSNLKEKLWKTEVIAYHQADAGKYKNILLPILAFKTRKKGSALWIISGIHGEEPAGPNAIAKNIKLFNRLAKKIPVILLPLCNPSGYWRDWRYPRRKKIQKYGDIESVGASDHLLIDPENPKKPRSNKPCCLEAAKISRFIIKNSKKYSPLVVIDFHEDNSTRKLYIYSQGKLGANDPIAREIVALLRKRGFRFYNKGHTSFNQKINEGIVSNIKDGSIDELLASDKIILNKKKIKGPNARSVIVIETNTVGIPLKKRVKAHSNIIKNLKKFYKIGKDIAEMTSQRYKKNSEIV